MHISIPDVNPCSLCGKEIYSASSPPYKEFTLASCGHIFHQKCLEKYLVNGDARCPNKDCNKDIETFLSPDLFKEKGSQDKTTTPTADTTSKRVDKADVIIMKELGILGGEEQSSSKTTAKETSDQATSPIEVVSTTPGNSENVDDSISKDSNGQIQRRICEKCSEDITIDFQKDTVFLSCSHAVHLDCINDLRKRCPICPSSETMSEVSTLIEQDPSDAQKKRARESSASTEKSSSKKAKKTGGKKKVSSTLKQLIEELLTDVAEAPVPDEGLEEANESATSIFLQLYDKIDSAESKNENASQGLIYSYFDFGEAVFKRYKELKLEHGKDGSQALVKSEVRKAIPEAKCSDEALRKRMERSEKVYKLFNSIGKEKIARIKSTPPSYVLNITKDETKYVMAEILTHKV